MAMVNRDPLLVEARVSDHRRDTFRSVYIVRLASRVFVLHSSQKKSKSGIATSKADIDLIT